MQNDLDANGAPSRVVVTGAASGIGRATALLLAERGSRLVLADLDSERGETLADEMRASGSEATFVRTDVSSGESVKALADAVRTTLGGLDSVINVAGVQRSKSLLEMTEDDWDVQLTVNAKSCFLTSRHLVPLLKEAGGGSIVVTASLAGTRGYANMTGYCSSKGAIISFAKALAVELGSSNIRVNSVSPGWVDTPFNQPVINSMGGVEKHSEVVAATVPLGRQAVPAEIAGVIAFLVSDRAGYLSGENLLVDGAAGA